MFSWFKNNQMTANDDKCHLLLNSSEEDPAIQREESKIKCSKKKKLLGIHIDYKLKFDIHLCSHRIKNHIDYKLKFDTHVDAICKKSHRKLTPLSKITNLMDALKDVFL